MSDLPHPRELIPHSGPAVLLDEVTSHTADETACTTVVSGDLQYVSDGNADAALALELMAQAVAVHVGLEGRWSGAGPRAGYVVGVPKMKFFGGDYREGTTLRVSVRVVFHEGPVGRFEGTVEDGDTVRAQGALTVFEPPLAEQQQGSEEASHER